MIRRLIVAALVATAVSACAQLPTAPEPGMEKSAMVSGDTKTASRCDSSNPWGCQQ